MDDRKNLKIALMGLRGVPAKYGGFETCAEELGKRLVRRGHQVSVYNRSGYYSIKKDTHAGMKLIYLPECRIKFFETLFHTFLCLMHSSFKQFDILLIFNNANSPLLIMPALLGRKVVFHMDGLEWKRGKWKGLGRWYYRFAEWLATKMPCVLISDSQEIKKYIKKKYGKNSHYIAYGASPAAPDVSHLTPFGLKPGEYILMITRFEPENNPLLAVHAFMGLNTDKKLALTGGVQYPSPYSDEIFSTQDRRIKFLGFQYDKDVKQSLLSNCFAYIHGNEVGGTNPALLEAMASGCFVICRDVPFNREVLQDAGIYFKKNPAGLADKISWALQHPEKLPPYQRKAQAIIHKKYNWNKVTLSYERLFLKLTD